MARVLEAMAFGYSVAGTGSLVLDVGLKYGLVPPGIGVLAAGPVRTLALPWVHWLPELGLPFALGDTALQAIGIVINTLILARLALLFED